MDFTMKWLTLLHGPDDIVEIRSIDPKPIISGYFKASSPAIATELAKYPNRTFYQTLNVVQPACYARGQHERLIEHPRETTSDNDIGGYQWILIDADPVRPSGVNASVPEKEAARKIAGAVMMKLMAMGFKEPVVADSGNGYHLLFKIHAATEERQTIADLLSVLDMWFSTDAVKIDTSVSNPARITKLYGTMARKGANTTERPCRVSRIIHFPEPIEESSMELVQNVADIRRNMMSEMKKPRQHNSAAFDLEQFLENHTLRVIKKITISSGTKYQLEECPFDSSHRNGDAAVFAFNNGCLGFHCFHNSCSGYHWHEFREKIDPAAYANSPYAIRPVQNISISRNSPSGKDGKILPSDNRPKQSRMLDFASIPNYDRSKIEVIRSRLRKLDAKIGGFNKGELSVWSGSNASGKSTLVNQLGLAAITEGYKVAVFSGEMTASRVRDCVLRQAAGPENVELDKLNSNHYCLKPGIEQKLDAMLAGRLSIYDNDFGTDWEVVLHTLYNWIKQNNAAVAIIDNMMALDIPHVSMLDKYDMQTRIVKRFSAIAKELNIHVHFICHPRKTEAFPRKGDISGTGDITNVADNVFMVHRVNVDFMGRYKTVYPKLEIPPGAGNTIEIMKNRDLGVVDEMIVLYFDKRSRTMSDVKGLPPQHAWSEKLDQVMLEECSLMEGIEVPGGFKYV